LSYSPGVYWILSLFEGRVDKDSKVDS
jgi:hypothetical protein